MLWTKPFVLRAHKATKYMYFCDKTHPLGDCSGIVAYHRHVASESLGRWLLSCEHVHHKDHNRQNNSPDNLEVLTHKEHAAMHAPAVGARECPSCKNTFVPPCNKHTYCSPKCAQASKYKADWSRLPELMVRHNSNLCAIGRELGVSSVAVKKHAKSLHLL